MKYTVVFIMCFFTVAQVRGEIGQVCDSSDDCNEENRERCVLPSPTESPEPTTASISSTSEANKEAYDLNEPVPVLLETNTCQCKVGYHISPVNDSSCAKDLKESKKGNFRCEKPIDCAEIDYPREDYEDKFEANPDCDEDIKFCTCGLQTDINLWVVRQNGDEQMCYHNAREDDKGELPCEYNQECVFLSKVNDEDNGGDGFCNKTVCACRSDGFIIKKDKLWSCTVAEGGPCKDDEDCDHITNAACAKEEGETMGKCKCKMGYTKITDFYCSSNASSLSSIVILLPALIFTKFSI